MGTSIRSAMRLLVVGLAVALVGCAGMSQAERDKLLNAQLQIAQHLENVAKEVAKEPSGNAGATAHALYQMRMDDFQEDMDKLTFNVMAPMLEYDYKMRRLPADVALRIWEAPNTGLLLCEFPLDCGRGRSGGTTFSAKNSDLRGAKFTLATDGSVLAQDEATAANRKSSVAQDDAMAATEEGKIIDGEGNTQAEVVTRPNTQKDLDFAGDGGDSSEGDGGDAAAGDNNAGTTGFGFEGSL